MGNNLISKKATTAGSFPDAVTWLNPDMEKEKVQQIISVQMINNVKSLRIGIDCKAFNSANGEHWYSWLMRELDDKFELELCFDNFSHSLTPPKYSLSEIVDFFIYRYGKQFARIELRRNPKAKFVHMNSSYEIFSDELAYTSSRATSLDKEVFIGGIQSGDFEWLLLMLKSGFLDNVEAIRLGSKGDFWSTHTGFFEQNLRRIFKESGINTLVYSSPITKN